MNTTETNILETTHSGLLILINRIDEYDYNGDLVVSKKICTVDSTIFNVSPYTSLDDMQSMVRVWIDCGCPADRNDIGIPRKWDKDSLHAEANRVLLGWIDDQ